MILGQRMIRLEDGVKGVVGQNGPELRIFFEDRGEQLMAPKSEKWIPDELPPMPLRDEEIARITWFADRALRAYERHEPLKWWTEPELPFEPYDHVLVWVIEDYLKSRRARPGG